ncbi:MAG: aminoglycoside phosphotransferase family protein [Cyclobacteriaceae bacterium]|nr:aminoglycoside phosphotransferase family protein [Cyclobacteriaceae bacterium]
MVDSRIIDAFFSKDTPVEVELLSSGHINDTYKLTVGNKQYVLQKINTSVFRDPHAVMNNLHKSVMHLKKKPYNLQILHSIAALNGKHLIEDQGGVWRLMPFMENGVALEEVKNKKQAFLAAKAYGHFLANLYDMKPDCMKETIPDFHNSPKRLQNFLNAVGTDPAGRLNKVQDLVDEISEEGAMVHKLTRWSEEGKLQRKIVHCDSKISNILVNPKTFEGIAVIDLDTMMPGYIMYDFGDMVRSFTNTTREDDPDLSKVSMSWDIFTAIASGFLDGLDEVISPFEKDTLVYGALLITYEQVIRFFEDYLRGDVYYKISYPDHNLHRTQNQWKLYQSIKSQQEEMERFIKNN